MPFEELAGVCSLCNINSRMKFASFFATVLYLGTAIAYLDLAARYDSVSLYTKEFLLGYFHGSRHLATGMTIMALIGALTSAMWFWSVHKGRRVWFIPFLVFWVMSCALQAIYIILLSISYSQMVPSDADPDDGIKEIRRDFARSMTWRTTLLVFELGFLFVLVTWYKRMRRQPPDGGFHGPVTAGYILESPSAPDVVFFAGKPKV